MKPSSMLIGLVALITSFTSSAAVQGEYLKTSSWQLKYIDESRYVWIYSYEYGQRKFSPVCTDTSPRKVPGKLVGNVCYVEWAGQEYANNYFYVLRDTGYMQFTRLTRASEDRIIQTGVTPGTIDEGYPVYHCKIEISGTGEVFLGKYIPSRNGCYYGFEGGNYKSMHDNSVTLSVLTSSRGY